MRYWDASALVPLVIAEETSKLARAWLEEDSSVVTWGWTRVEMVGAVERRARDGSLNRQHRRDALERIAALADAWDEVTDLLAVRSRAIPLLARHQLRAADAAQLGAALLLADPDPSSIPFVCLDDRLAAIAEREGLNVVR